MTLKFEWNKSKAKDNFDRHGVSFELAKEVFKDPFAVEFFDDRQDYGEERFVIIGMAASPPFLRDLYRTAGLHQNHIRPEGDET